MNEYLFRLKKVMDEKNFSETAFARAIGSSQGSINSMFRRDTVPKVDFLKDIAGRFTVNLNWLLTGEGPMYQDEPGFPKPQSIQHLNGHITDNPDEEGAFVVPMLEQSVSAGKGSHLEDDDNIAGYVALPPAITAHGAALAALPVRGDSMYPTIDNGDMVVCDGGGYDGEGIYVLRMDGEALVKRLAKRPGGVMVISDNGSYPDFEVSRDTPLDVIGRIRAVVKVVK